MISDHHNNHSQQIQSSAVANNKITDHHYRMKENLFHGEEMFRMTLKTHRIITEYEYLDIHWKSNDEPLTMTMVCFVFPRLVIR